ncbi:MAG: glutathione S-transferase [Halioglobus sp.]|jgi:glutathione S-transferase
MQALVPILLAAAAMIILHHYELSPFSEKLRLMFGYAGLPWQSLVSPEMPPRPNLDPLTGGYRRIPVAQKGADLFCDTRLICDEVAALTEMPELATQYGNAATQAYAAELESTVFWACVLSIPAGVTLKQLLRHIGVWKTLRFLKDRTGVGKSSRMNVPSPREAARVFQQHLEEMEQRLTGQFLFADDPTNADFSAYHTLWFKREIGKLPMPLGLPKVADWYDRMQAFGHNERCEISQAQAFQAAFENEPRAISNDASAAADVGKSVSICPTDYALDAVNGTLVGCSATRYIVARESKQFGTVHVHFPRAGFACQTA